MRLWRRQQRKVHSFVVRSLADVLVCHTASLESKAVSGKKGNLALAEHGASVSPRSVCWPLLLTLRGVVARADIRCDIIRSALPCLEYH